MNIYNSKRILILTSRRWTGAARRVPTLVEGLEAVMSAPAFSAFLIIVGASVALTSTCSPKWKSKMLPEAPKTMFKVGSLSPVSVWLLDCSTTRSGLSCFYFYLLIYLFIPTPSCSIQFGPKLARELGVFRNGFYDFFFIGCLRMLTGSCK